MPPLISTREKRAERNPRTRTSRAAEPAGAPKEGIFPPRRWCRWLGDELETRTPLPRRWIPGPSPTEAEAGLWCSGSSGKTTVTSVCPRAVSWIPFHRELGVTCPPPRALLCVLGADLTRQGIAYVFQARITAPLNLILLSYCAAVPPPAPAPALPTAVSLPPAHRPSRGAAPSPTLRPLSLHALSPAALPVSPTRVHPFEGTKDLKGESNGTIRHTQSVGEFDSMLRPYFGTNICTM